MKTAVLTMARPASSAIAKLLGHGVMLEALVRLARQSREQFTKQLAALQRALEAETATSRELVNATDHQVDASAGVVARLTARINAAQREIQSLDERLAVLGSRECVTAFTHRDEQEAGRRERNIAAWQRIEAHLEAAATELLGMRAFDQHQRGAVQRFMDLAGASGASSGIGAVSPAVQHRRNESLAAIFVPGAHRPQPPEAA